MEENINIKIHTKKSGKKKKKNLGKNTQDKRKDGTRQLMNSHRAPSFRRCSFDCMLRNRTPFLQG